MSFHNKIRIRTGDSRTGCLAEYTGCECSGESVLPTGRRAGQSFSSVAGFYTDQFIELGACNDCFVMVLALEMRTKHNEGECKEIHI